MLDIAKVDEIARPVRARALTPFGLAALSFSSQRDYEGDPIIVAIAEYARDAPKLDSRAWIDAVVEAMKLLATHGDDRFVHLRHVYPHEEAARDDFGSQLPRQRRSGRSR
jgi:hypothetical protein